MAKFKNSYKIVSQTEISEGIFDLLVECEEIAKAARAGQFVNVFVGDAAKLLPRPISICEIVDERCIRLVYRVTEGNSGTKLISQLTSKDCIEILGPLGNGFEIPKEDVSDVMLIGGGIGIPPMLELAKQIMKYKMEEVSKDGVKIKESECGSNRTKVDDSKNEINIVSESNNKGCSNFTKNKNNKVSVLLGYRDCETFLLEDFERFTDVQITTDDGSMGFHGTTVDYLKQCETLPKVVLACGPTPMLRALKEFCEWKQIRCYLSLEERMACGIGACLACMVKTNSVNPNINISNARVCKEGPVFLSTEVVL